MQSISTVGLDIAKSVFQVHGVDAAGQVVVRPQLRRRYVLAFFQKLPPCLVGIEACASSHHWSRELQGLGHTVRLMPSGLCEALRQAAEERQHRRGGDLRGGHATQYAVRADQDVEQQSCLMLHRARHLLIRQQTVVINSIRAYLSEFGIVAPVGRRGVEQLLEVAADTADHRLPEVARTCLAALGSQLRALKAQILEFDRRIIAWHRSSATSKRLDAIPAVGPALATALVASIADPKAFRSGRDFSAWVGLVPKQNSSGGKDKLGSISKQGDRYLRSLFTSGALAVIRYAKIHGTDHRPWLTRLLARRPTKVAAIALANKLARMAWAMMARNERYKQPAALAA
ncbi:IS110 family transposase [Bradyrhizobium sp. CCBAU 11361]|uniref:IS110 family transposase n=1 Tax=Bradyrhizobium sp. CCBAU 11361 TaxID=1630812 RepID=UPI00230440E5|nr:IS110 family transposase [Bradyrhizobium sp. CCBAU 11361]